MNKKESDKARQSAYKIHRRHIVNTAITFARIKFFVWLKTEIVWVNVSFQDIKPCD